MHVMGTAVRTLLLAIQSEYGDEALAKVKGALPEPVQRELEKPVLASATYPIEVSASLHEAIRTQLGGGTFVVNRKLGIAAARMDFSGVHRVFIRVADYETLLHATARAWVRYNSHGRVEWSHITARSATGTVRYVLGYTEAMWHAIAGRIETILILGGAKSASCVVEAFSDKHVVYQVTWTP